MKEAEEETTAITRLVSEFSNSNCYRSSWPQGQLKSKLSCFTGSEASGLDLGPCPGHPNGYAIILLPAQSGCKAMGNKPASSAQPPGRAPRSDEGGGQPGFEEG